MGIELMVAASTLGIDWEALGAGASTAVDTTHAILVTGTDPVAAARVAIGIGRAQSTVRRVAIGDLVGDVEPLQRLVTGDDPHGIIDSFLHGVSLNKIARQVDESGMLFVMPSGTEPLVTPEIMRNERWSRLAAGFREVGALLVLVAPSEAEGVHELAVMLDGVVIVGDPSAMLSVPRNAVVAHVEAPVMAAAAASALPTPTAVRPEDMLQGPPLLDDAVPHTEAEAPERRMPKGFGSETASPSRTPLIVAAVVIGLAALWFALGRPGMPTATPESVGANPDSVIMSPAPASLPDTTSLSPDTTSAADSLVVLRVENPQDSLKAAQFGVVIVATNDEAQALARWAELGLKLPAGTVTMVRIRGELDRFFQMQAGAYLKASQADSLLAALRSSGKLAADAGRVVSTPYALMLEAKVSSRAAQNVSDGYGQRQIAAYPLLQDDRTATIFVGAFETPDQAIPLMNELKAKGVTATLQYRTGRSF